MKTKGDNLKEKLIIFTAGIWAEFAYDFYKDKYQIECFVDNNRMLNGTKKCGLPIRSPEKLGQWDGTVAIADGQYEKEIRDQLSREYRIDKIISFQDELRSIREEMKKRGICKGPRDRETYGWDRESTLSICTLSLLKESKHKSCDRYRKLYVNFCAKFTI